MKLRASDYLLSKKKLEVELFHFVVVRRHMLQHTRQPIRGDFSEKQPIKKWISLRRKGNTIVLTRSRWSTPHRHLRIRIRCLNDEAEISQIKCQREHNFLWSKGLVNLSLLAYSLVSDCLTINAITVKRHRNQFVSMRLRMSLSSISLQVHCKISFTI